MPRQYEAIRDKFVSQGMSLKEAKSHAAAIYNSKHPGNPVGAHYEAKLKKKKRRDHLRELGESMLKNGTY
jgi:hypothetical protein